MLFDFLVALRRGDMEALKWAFAGLLLSLPIILLALCIHEVSHGFVANKLGDPTAKSFGRLTLNPLKHFEPFGFLCMLCLGIGWAKPIPINTRYFKKPRRDMAICAVAGPISNLLMALLFAVLMRVTYIIANANEVFFLSNEWALTLFQVLVLLFTTGIRLNVGLAVFNMIPLPPLDGSRVLYLFLPQRALMFFLQNERYIQMGLIVWLIAESYLPFGIITPLVSYATSYIVQFFYLILGF